jgi:hypothetical protein
MGIREVAPEQLAELFHHYHHALAPDFGGEKASTEIWEQMPQQEKSLLIAAARLALQDLAAAERDGARRFFASPGEAEWGC